MGGEWRRRFSGLEEEEVIKMEVGAVKEVGQSREAGDRLTSGGNLTRPPELHRSGTAKNKTREASPADKRKQHTQASAYTGCCTVGGHTHTHTHIHTHTHAA